ncbi:MAG: trigger factor [Dehalococcoidales bacterium]|nr:trigger factor [Dehalococcoidales bacterium]
MKVTNEKTENRQVFLTIEMEPEEVAESMEKAYRRLVTRTKIPGFRVGKAPRAVLERHIGKESLLEDALNSLVPEAYQKAIAEQEIEAIAQPQIEITGTEPVVFTATVPLRPEVKLGDYHQVKLSPESVTVTDENIDAVMEQLRHQHATWEPVERPVDFNDLAVLDVESSIDGQPFINQQGAQFQVLRDFTFPAPGLAEQLVGMKSGAEKEFTLQIPAEYPRPELAGKEPHFKVKVTGVKQEILPELNDELAKLVNPEYETLAALRERVAADMTLRAEERARMDFEERVIDGVVGLSEVEFPPILIEAEIHRIIDQRFQRGDQTLEQYLSSVNKTEEELHEELRPVAITRVTRSLVLGKVVEEEKIEADDSEIDAEIDKMVASSGDKKEELKKILNTAQTRESIRQTLITQKAVQRLVDMAKETKKPRKKRDKEAK